ncbi:unnamed protein product [Urochloa humidicola]
MDPPPLVLDDTHGRSFEAKVRAQFGTPVVTLTLDDHCSFSLLAAFSRSKLRLDESSVGSILQSILGGSANLFVVAEVEESIFKFTVFSKVGFFIYRIQEVATPSLRVFFHLWNLRGISKARRSVLTDRGPLYDWEEVRSRKNKVATSPISVHKVFKRISTDLHAAKPSVFSRLNFSSVPDDHLQQQSNNSQSIPANHTQTRWTEKRWVPVQTQVPRSKPINFGENFAHHQRETFVEVVKKVKSPILSGTNSVPLEQFKNPVAQGHYKRQPFGPASSKSPVHQCSRCFSHQHLRPACTQRVRCKRCYRLGHISFSCPFPPRSLGLPKAPSFPDQPCHNGKKVPETSSWFRRPQSLNGGPNPVQPPCFASFSDFASHQAATRGAPSASPLLFQQANSSTPPPPPPPPPFAAPHSSLAARQQATLDLDLHLGQRPDFAAPIFTSVYKTPSPSTVPPPPPEAVEMPRFVDPSPFLHRGFNQIMIQGRRPMSRAIMGRQPRRNNDLAIATFAPMPGHAVSFHGIEDVLGDFLHNVARVGFKTIQPTPLGQA